MTSAVPRASDAIPHPVRAELTVTMADGSRTVVTWNPDDEPGAGLKVTVQAEAEAEHEGLDGMPLSWLARSHLPVAHTIRVEHAVWVPVQHLVPARDASGS